MRRRFFNSDSKVAFNTDNYLTIEALEDGLTVEFSKEIEYGINGIGWSKLRYGSSTPPINTGQTISFRGELESNVGSGVGMFLISNRCNLLGNCMSILFGNNAADSFSLKGKESVFLNLFKNCPIVSVSGNFLPATTLEYSCYNSMFRDCTSLQTAPELPATTLANYCYGSMFYGCTSLQTAPELPATTLTDYCYGSMFRGCTSLNYIKMLATDISAFNCLDYWVYGIETYGTFVKNKNMNNLPIADSFNDYAGRPSGWTVRNA